METRFLDGLKKRGYRVKLATDGSLKFSKGTSGNIKTQCLKNMAEIVAELTYVDSLKKTVFQPNAASRVYADYPDAELQRAEDAYVNLYELAAKNMVIVWFWETGQPKPKDTHCWLKPGMVGGRYTFTPMLMDEDGEGTWFG